MIPHANLEIFLVAPPGLEMTLRDEATALGFRKVKAMPGGARFRGSWRDVWRANLELRGASRVLARLGAFQVMHLANLEKLAREFPWHKTLRPEVPVRVEVTTRKSKIYHAGAATERFERAIVDEFGGMIDPEALVCIRVRIDDNMCTVSVDTSGDLLHKRGYKSAVGKAPMRETLAALFLRQCGYTGTEPVLDPMCGSGTFVIEAAEMAMGLAPGRARDFAFEYLATFDADAWTEMRDLSRPVTPDVRFYGSDRDEGAISASIANAERAGVEGITQFSKTPVADLARPDGPPGLVMVNPPYGTRIGDKKQLFALHGTLGKTLKSRFAGWRVGLVTTEGALAHATGLPFLPPGPPVAHGGLRVKLYRSDPL